MLTLLVGPVVILHYWSSWIQLHLKQHFFWRSPGPEVMALGPEPNIRRRLNVESIVCQAERQGIWNCYAGFITTKFRQILKLMILQTNESYVRNILENTLTFSCIAVSWKFLLIVCQWLLLQYFCREWGAKYWIMDSACRMTSSSRLLSSWQCVSVHQWAHA